MEILTKKIVQLIAENGIDLHDENVIIAFADGTITVSLDDKTKTINVDVEFVDRVINMTNLSIEEDLL